MKIQDVINHFEDLKEKARGNYGSETKAYQNCIDYLEQHAAELAPAPKVTTRFYPPEQADPDGTLPHGGTCKPQYAYTPPPAPDCPECEGTGIGEIKTRYDYDPVDGAPLDKYDEGIPCETCNGTGKAPPAPDALYKLLDSVDLQIIEGDEQIIWLDADGHVDRKAVQRMIDRANRAAPDVLAKVPRDPSGELIKKLIDALYYVTFYLEVDENALGYKNVVAHNHLSNAKQLLNSIYPGLYKKGSPPSPAPDAVELGIPVVSNLQIHYADPRDAHITELEAEIARLTDPKMKCKQCPFHSPVRVKELEGVVQELVVALELQLREECKGCQYDKICKGTYVKCDLIAKSALTRARAALGDAPPAAEKEASDAE